MKFIWDVVSRIRVGEGGAAYVVDGTGRLIAHPDIGLVLRKTDLSKLDQVLVAAGAGKHGATAGSVRNARDHLGRRVLAAYAPVEPLDWQVFVELPLAAR